MHVPDLHGHPPIGPDPQPATGDAEARCACRAATATRPRTRSRTRSRPGGRVSLASLTSSLTLLALIAGLGYGAHALLRDLQQVGFAPMELAPKRLTQASLITPPTLEQDRRFGRQISAREWERMFLPAAAVEPPTLAMASRDGPISAIDPDRSGLFAPGRAATPELPADDAAPASSGAPFPTPDGPNGGQRISLSPDEAARAEPVVATALENAPPRVMLHASDEVWIRVRDGEAVIFEGILPPGGQYEVPHRAERPLLRAGNAGALYVLLDETPYGPVGSSRRVLKNMSLRAEDIAARLPDVRGRSVCPGSDGPILLHAAANLGR